MVSICICLMANNAEYLCTCLFTILISSLVRNLFKSFAHFYIGLVELWEFLLLSFESSLYNLDTSPLSKNMGCKYFLPVYSLSFNSLASVFDRAKVFNLDKVQFIDFFCVCASGIVSNLGSKKLFPMFFPTGFKFITLCFTFASMTHFKLIFVSKVSFFGQGSCFYRWMSNCYKTICWEDYPFLNKLILYICQRSNAYIHMVYFRTSDPAPLIHH